MNNNEREDRKGKWGGIMGKRVTWLVEGWNCCTCGERKGKRGREEIRVKVNGGRGGATGREDRREKGKRV